MLLDSTFDLLAPLMGQPKLSAKPIRLLHDAMCGSTAGGKAPLSLYIQEVHSRVLSTIDGNAIEYTRLFTETTGLANR